MSDIPVFQTSQSITGAKPIERYVTMTEYDANFTFPHGPPILGQIDNVAITPTSQFSPPTLADSTTYSC